MNCVPRKVNLLAPDFLTVGALTTGTRVWEGAGFRAGGLMDGGFTARFVDLDVPYSRWPCRTGNLNPTGIPHCRSP